MPTAKNLDAYNRLMPTASALLYHVLDEDVRERLEDAFDGAPTEAEMLAALNQIKAAATPPADVRCKLPTLYGQPYRACYYQDRAFEDGLEGGVEAVLTGPEHAHLSNGELFKLGLAETQRRGLPLDVVMYRELYIGDWVDA